MGVSVSRESSGGERMMGALQAGSEGSVPSKKFKRIKREEVPQAFDLDLVNCEDVTYLPGGIDRAMHDAKRNRHQTFHGVSWSLGGEILVAPGDWLLLPFGGSVEGDRRSWWLIYSSGPQQSIIVSQGGGYLRFTKENFLTLTLDVRRLPPWIQEIAP